MGSSAETNTLRTSIRVVGSSPALLPLKRSSCSPAWVLRPVVQSLGRLESLETLESLLETLESLETLETLESLETLETLESWETLESLESWETLETLESWETLETLESWETLESLESLESLGGLGSLESPPVMSGLQRSEVWTEVTSDELKEHIDTIEEAYEFFLAYAAQGVSGSGTGISGELTNYLSRADQALAAFEGGIGDAAEGQDAEAVAAMDRVLQQDAGNTRAALRLVMAQSSISSQLIDNLNASIHFRALLTDLFLVDEALKASLATRG